VEKIIDMQTGLPYIYPVRKQCLIKYQRNIINGLRITTTWGVLGRICGYACSVKL